MGRESQKEGLYPDVLKFEKPSIGITIGDPAGIGPEIIEAALQSGELDPGFDYEILGNTSGHSPGMPTTASAKAAIEALEIAVDKLKSGEIMAVVTGPIHKAGMQAAGFSFPGHTEFFANRFGVKNFAMLLTGKSLTVALATIHIPLKDVSTVLNTGEIVRVGSLLAEFLRLRHDRTPRIAVAGLNPHAGESGTIGSEETTVIAPAVEKLKETWKKEAVFAGPFSPDTVFHEAVSGNWDAVLCMYHDQGLIPLKLHAFDHGVNITLGLPVIRTSPDHGTAFDIAGKNKARPHSMIAAINMAAELVKKKYASYAK